LSSDAATLDAYRAALSEVGISDIAGSEKKRFFEPSLYKVLLSLLNTVLEPYSTFDRQYLNKCGLLKYMFYVVNQVLFFIRDITSLDLYNNFI